uniref:Uncharacterized protein n=1 Tax=Timema tahoe TaxID=61484 RepID=A0A7R9FJN6_9NEOP|nr:unnamed protein product [Timema tahoe]
MGNHLGNTALSRPDRDSNPNLPVISRRKKTLPRANHTLWRKFGGLIECVNDVTKRKKKRPGSRTFHMRVLASSSSSRAHHSSCPNISCVLAKQVYYGKKDGGKHPHTDKSVQVADKYSVGFSFLSPCTVSARFT